MTFFPGVPDVNAATRLVIRPGMELWNQDIQLQAARVHWIRGRVLDPFGAVADHVRVTLSYTNILRLEKDRETSVTSGDDGVFEFPSAVSETWQLTAEAERAGETLRAFAMAAVTGADLDHIELRLSPPFTVPGTVVSESISGIQPRETAAIIMLVPEGGGGVFHEGKVDAGGRFQIAGVYPGRYTVRTFSSSPPYYLASVRLGEREILGVEPVEIVSGALPLTVTFRTDGGTVRGSVEDCGSSATVRLIPQDANLRLNDLIRTARCTENGRFEIANIRPGEYYVVVLDLSPDLQDMFFGFDLDQDLINQAIRVTVRSSETTATALRVIRRP